MNFEEILDFLARNTGYLKWGPTKLANKLGATEESCRRAIVEAKEKHKKIHGMNVSKMWKMPGSDKWGISLKHSDAIDYAELDEMVEKAFEKVNPIIRVKPPNPKKIAKGSLLLFLADQHIGAKTGEGQYDNHYDASEVSNRMDKLSKAAQSLTNLYGLDSAYLILLGDSLDGMDGKTTRGGHSLPQNMTNQEALECFLESHIQLIEDLREIFPKVEVHMTCNSNHGGDFEYAAHRMLELYYKKQNVDVRLYTRFLSHFKVGDISYIITHGKDKINKTRGLPKYLNSDTELYIAQYIREHNITGKVRVVKGDLHVDTDESGKLFSYRNVPSFFGGSDWVMDNFGITVPGVGYDIIKNGNLHKGIIDVI